MQTLDQFFRSEYAPLFLSGKDRRTLQAYRETISLAVEVLDDPSIGEVNLYAAQFVRTLQDRGLANSTIAKHCRHLNAVFNKLGPKGKKNHDALGKLKFAPYFPLPQCRKKDPRLFCDSDFQALYRAFGNQDAYPRYLPRHLRPRYWQVLMHFVSVTALRRQAVLGLEWCNVNSSELFVRVSSETDKKDRLRFKPITEELLAGLREIRVGDNPRSKVFPWTHGNKTWYECWNRAETLAVVKLGLHDLKRFSGELALRAGASVLELQQHMDHSNIRTTLDHYVRPQTRELVNRLHVPIPEKPEDPLEELGIQARMDEAGKMVDQMQLEFLVRNGIDLQKLAEAARGEIWTTSSGSLLRIFDERRIG